MTGGNAALVVEARDVEGRCEPHLILAGIAIAVEAIRKAASGG